MDPYYEDEHVALYHGDCIEHADLWSGADVLVTDPPYGMSFQSGQRRGPKLKRIAGDDSIVLRENMLAAWGEEKPGLVFGTWRVPPPTGREAAPGVVESEHRGYGRFADAVGHVARGNLRDRVRLGS